MAAAESTVRLRTPQGELQGRRRRSVWGFPFCSFQGIPYAQPPVGPLRFKPPKPAPAWTGVLDATKEGNVAPQMDVVTGEYIGDEDCLFINVSTPRLPSEAPSAGELLPVMVWVHGGGLATMSGNEDFSRPDFLIEKGVVYVSFNYRLGVLGFLSTGEQLVPGNMGFKDQVLALRWVKDNIASFGGDPDNVTIFGCSAGGWSVHALVLSPLADGLFHRAIAQSGVAFTDYAVTPRVRDRSFALGAHLGLETDDSQQLVDFLRKQPARRLVENAMSGRTEDDKTRSVLFPFVGTVEPDDAEGGAFFPREPLEQLRSRDFQHVPFIIGVCTYEASVFAAGPMKKWIHFPSYHADHRLLIPSDMRCPKAFRDAVAQKIKHFYFGKCDVGPDTEIELCLLWADQMFIYPAVHAAKQQSAMSVSPVHFFVFDYVSKEVPGGSMGEVHRRTSEKFDVSGAGHGGELPYLCRGTMMGDAPARDSSDGELTDKMTRLWTNLAKTGQLTDPLVEVSWPAFTWMDGSYLHVTSQGLSVAKRPFQERVAFWEQLYGRFDRL